MRNALILGVLPLVLAPRAAHGGNEDEIFVGNDAAVVGGAVVASTDDGSSVWYNPAGLARAERSQLDATTSVYSLRLYRADDFARTTGGARTPLSATDFVSVPVQISYVRPLGAGLSLGLGYFQPRASKLIVRARQRAEDGDVTSDVSISGTALYSEIGLGAALGMRPWPGWRFGVGGLLRWDSLLESIDFSGSTKLGGDVVELLQRGNLREQDVFGVEPSVGVQWDATPKLAFGVSARGPRLGLYNRGRVSSSTNVAIQDATEPGLASESEDESLGKTSAAIVRLGRYFAGLSYRLGKLGLHADADLQPGYSAPKSGVNRRLCWNARLGAAYDLGKWVTLGLGAFTDRAATDTNEGSLVTNRANFWGGSVGLRVRNEHLLAESEPVSSLIFNSVVAFRYAYADARTEALVVDSATPSLLEGLALTEAQMTVHELALYVGGGVYF